ncbi:protein FAR1-RELATED SEQUENCE 5-like [Chenopodium quinoa]|uniref:protein FAR1-RELATED SEQUENCE 5-like n=1 Tax=Chenopodium quinoa TaxID=63459 RepID=UPI000B7851C5|nr:protein FAR1-RELATED SEQUENCE 5-like [Chenopodium quinoa]
MENSTFDTTNCSNLIHELLQKQRQIETEFEIDLNRSIIEEEETNCFGDEFVPIFNNPDNADEAIDNADEAIENAEDAIHNAENQLPYLCSNVTLRLYAENSDYLRGSFVGVVRETFEEILELYEKHAAILGFSIRKHTTRFKQHTKIVTEKNYVCSAEGKRHSGQKKTKLVEMVDEEDVNVKIRKPRQVSITRSNCKACIRAKVNKEGQFEVVAHVIQHNHELKKPQWHYLHRSERKMTEEKVVTIKTMKSSGLTTMDTYNYMATEAGGEQNIGHSVVDHLNFCSRLRMEQIEAGDAQTLVNILSQEQSEDPNFFFRVKFDKEGRICNIFWRDSMMLEDYRIYGDVLVFDTTYRTNIYNLICAPFVGINNHWHNCMFACAFIGDETTDSFVWLLQTFFKAMEDRKPTSIFTDQDQAMANVILEVIPNTRHRLCIWHLEQNAITRFGALKKDKEFKFAFNQCLKMCVTEQEFEAKWQAMLQKYELTEHSWYKRVYELKDKWCPTLCRDFFSAGILSSQRSESTNHAIGFRASKATTLIEFYTIFKKTTNRWRSTEKYDEFTCSKSIAFTSLPLSGMLKHAAQLHDFDVHVFTLSLFRNFEEEFGYSMATTVQMLGSNEECLLYQVTLEDKPWSAHQVNYIQESQTVWCTCKNFEASGWLCYHCIRILHLHSVTRIPDKYVSKRWTKFAKTEAWDRLKNQDPKQQYIPWRQTMMRKYYNLILKSQENEETRAFMEESFRNSLKMVEDLLTSAAQKESAEAASNIPDVADNTQSNTDASSASSTSTCVPIILDPKRAVTKGRSKRAKGGLEKSKRKRKPALPPPNSEFGSKTPNLRLF